MIKRAVALLIAVNFIHSLIVPLSSPYRNIFDNSGGLDNVNGTLAPLLKEFPAASFQDVIETLRRRAAVLPAGYERLDVQHSDIRSAFKRTDDSNTVVVVAVKTAGAQEPWGKIEPLRNLFEDKKDTKPGAAPGTRYYYTIDTNMSGYPYRRVVTEDLLRIGLQYGADSEVIVIRRCAVPADLDLAVLARDVLRGNCRPECLLQFCELLAAACSNNEPALRDTLINSVFKSQPHVYTELVRRTLHHPVKIIDLVVLMTFAMAQVDQGGMRGFPSRIHTLMREFAQQPEAKRVLGVDGAGFPAEMHKAVAGILEQAARANQDMFVNAKAVWFDTADDVLGLVLMLASLDSGDTFNKKLTEKIKRGQLRGLIGADNIDHTLMVISEARAQAEGSIAQLLSSAGIDDAYKYSLQDSALLARFSSASDRDRFLRLAAAVNWLKYLSVSLVPERTVSYMEESWNPEKLSRSTIWRFEELVAGACFDAAVKGEMISATEAASSAVKKMEDIHGFYANETEELVKISARTLDDLAAQGLILKRSNGLFQAVSSGEEGLIPLAMFTKDHGWIAQQLRAHIAAAQQEDAAGLYNFLRVCGIFAQTGERLYYPLDAQYPLLWAALSLTDEQQAVLRAAIVAAPPHVRNLSAVDSIKVLLDRSLPQGRVEEGWAVRMVPDIAGRDFFANAAELFPPKGGLGRVLIAHNLPRASLLDKASTVNLIAPLYELNHVTNKAFTKEELVEIFRSYMDPGADAQALARLESQIDDIVNKKFVFQRRITFYSNPAVINVYQLTLKVEGRDIQLYLWRHEEEHPAKKLTERVYDYGWPDSGKATWEDFSSAMNEVAINEVILAVSEDRAKEKGASWKPPVVQMEDAQSTLGPLYWFDQAQAAVKKRDRGEPLTVQDRVLIESLLMMKVHTIDNVHTNTEGAVTSLENTGDLSSAREALPYGGVRFGDTIFRSWQDFFRNRFGTYDFTRAGAASTILLKGVLACVSRVHRRVLVERLHLYPEDVFRKAFIAVTNGDLLPLSAGKLLGILKEMGIKPAGYEAPPANPIGTITPKQILDANVRARERVNETLQRRGEQYLLNPEVPMTFFSGRGVSIKTGMFLRKPGEKDFFTKETLEQALQFSNVVYYMNEAGDSWDVMNMLRGYQRELNNKGLPGKLVVVYGFSHEEQFQLFAAADLVMNPSAYWTGASEITEQNAMICGASIMAWPWQEGAMYAVLPPELCVIPANHSAEAVLYALRRFMGLYHTDKEAFARRKIQIMNFARVVDGALTAKIEMEAIQRNYDAVKQSEYTRTVLTAA